MKIKIESDVFDIVERIKEIDDGYYIVFDTIKQKLELHNYKQSNSYCFTLKQDSIDSRLIDDIYKSSIVNLESIIEEMDFNNEKIEKDSYSQIRDDSDYKLREIYKFINNSSRQYDENIAFSTEWR